MAAFSGRVTNLPSSFKVKSECSLDVVLWQSVVGGFGWIVIERPTTNRPVLKHVEFLRFSPSTLWRWLLWLNCVLYRKYFLDYFLLILSCNRVKNPQNSDFGLNKSQDL